MPGSEDPMVRQQSTSTTNILGVAINISWSKYCREQAVTATCVYVHVLYNQMVDVVSDDTPVRGLTSSSMVLSTHIEMGIHTHTQATQHLVKSLGNHRWPRSECKR